ncbi:MAG: tryptophan--tRNA ligase [Deltaproteobacteria bacterium RIFCSPLOWO2_12_FULL_60_19]|nr:MAG: tryptophan--tRNA ligase [Deltaproteobacteria bacterium RIFCSPLOWO2_12_FULL_60_19]
MATIVSGMRPTGNLHLGHLHGALKNWLRLQESYQCFFFVADWHALTTDYATPQGIQESGLEMMKDWLSVGLDPKRCVIFRQSAVKQHAELHLLLSMITPVPWLERNPTYKEQIREIVGKDLSTYGFLGYPVLQAADIVMYKAHKVPVGADQAPHLELTREIVRRFNQFYGQIFPEPEVLLTEIPKVPGLDGRKMSKSYGNAVFLTDSPKEIDRKLSRMMTDPARVRRQDPGEPEKCPAFNLHKIYCTPDEIDYVSKGCRTAGIGCLDCKKIMIKHVVEELQPFQEKRAGYDRRPGDAEDALSAGNRAAQEKAAETMEQVRSAVGL